MNIDGSTKMSLISATRWGQAK